MNITKILYSEYDNRPSFTIEYLNESRFVDPDFESNVCVSISPNDIFVSLLLNKLYLHFVIANKSIDIQWFEIDGVDHTDIVTTDQAEFVDEIGQLVIELMDSINSNTANIIYERMKLIYTKLVNYSTSI